MDSQNYGKYTDFSSEFMMKKRELKVQFMN